LWELLSSAPDAIIGLDAMKLQTSRTNRLVRETGRQFDNPATPNEFIIAEASLSIGNQTER
jgi:hypothetical protein